MKRNLQLRFLSRKACKAGLRKWYNFLIAPKSKVQLEELQYWKEDVIDFTKQKNPVEILLDKNDLDGAVALLKTTDGINPQELMLAVSQYSQLKRNVSANLYTGEDRRYNKAVARIKYVLQNISYNGNFNRQ